MQRLPAKPQVQWIEAEIACGAKSHGLGNGKEIELLGSGAKLRVGMKVMRNWQP